MNMTFPEGAGRGFAWADVAQGSVDSDRRLEPARALGPECYAYDLPRDQSPDVELGLGPSAE